MSQTKREVVHVVDKFDLLKLVQEGIDEIGIDDSFFIADVGDVIRKYTLWKELFPRIDPDYAIKSNNLPIVANTLAALGAGFDCASHGEIEQVLGMGVHPDRIILAQTVKPIYNIKLARDKKIHKMTLDNEFELLKVKEHFPNADIFIRLAFSPKSTNKIAFGAKFGCSLDDGKELLKKAKKLNLNVRGVAFHIGMGCEEYEIFEKAIKDSANLFKIGIALGHKMDILDIGGGFPGYETDTIKGLSKTINKVIDDCFPLSSNVKIISEPGQYFSTHCMTLVVNVHSKAIKENENGEKIYHYYITDGIYQSFSMKGSGGGTDINPVNMKPLKNTTGMALKKSVIWGRTCDPNDQVESEILLPELDCGDWLILENFGAYRITTSCSFNGFQKHPIFSYVERDAWETFKAMRMPGINIGYDVIEK